MQNPFRYGDIAAGEHFTNRVKELQALEMDLNSGQNVVIISPRRYGKTSLVKRAIERLREEGHLVAYVDLFNAPTKARLVHVLADAFFKGIESPLEQKLQAARELFKNLSVKPVFSLSEEGKPTMELAPAARESDVDRDLDRLFHLPGEIARRRGKRVVLVMDEFQEILGIDPHLPGRLRAIFQEQTDVAHLYLGSKYHLMNQVFNDANQPFYKSAKHLPLEPIAPGDFKAFVRERFRSTRKAIADDVIDQILSLTACHPNDTQELCYFVWAEAQAQGGAPAIATVERAFAQIIAAENARYTFIWDELPASQRMLLMALARDPGGAFSESFRRAHGLGAATTVQRAQQRLKERELIELKPDGGYQVPDVFFRAWLKQRDAS